MPAQSPYYRPMIRPPAPAPQITPQYCKIAHNQAMQEQFLKQHLRLYIYVWTTAHNSFWMYPLELSSGVLSGYVWQKRGWQYSRLRLSQIDSFF